MKTNQKEKKFYIVRLNRMTVKWQLCLYEWNKTELNWRDRDWKKNRAKWKAPKKYCEKNITEEKIMETNTRRRQLRAHKMERKLQINKNDRIESITICDVPLLFQSLVKKKKQPKEREKKNCSSCMEFEFSVCPDDYYASIGHAVTVTVIAVVVVAGAAVARIHFKWSEVNRKDFVKFWLVCRTAGDRYGLGLLHVRKHFPYNCLFLHYPCNFIASFDISTCTYTHTHNRLHLHSSIRTINTQLRVRSNTFALIKFSTQPYFLLRNRMNAWLMMMQSENQMALWIRNSYARNNTLFGFWWPLVG